MWPYLSYILLLFFCAFSDLLPIKNRWIACGTLLAVMAVMAIFRDNIGGYDFFMYSLYYKAAVPINDYLQDVLFLNITVRISNAVLRFFVA